MVALGFAVAQDGKVLYETYCGACHAPDGSGINNGQFPPLAGSLWVQGKPDRMVQAVLHGLQGPIAVGEKEYNLVMPPQGGTLTDEQLAKIVTHVRSSWGHQEAAVSAADIKAQRAVTKDRTEMWASSQLLEKYPLTAEVLAKGAIKNLVATVYHGKFKSMADLAKAEPAAVEEEQDGILRIDKVGRKDHFGIIWEGDLEVPEDGNYTFLLDSDDGSSVRIDGEEVVKLDRVGPAGKAVKGKVKLKKGTHRLRVAYFEFESQEVFHLAWSGPGLKGVQWLTPRARRGKKPRGYPSIPIEPLDGEAVIYRNFIEGVTARAIGVGYDGGVNLAFSADAMTIELIWLEQFMSGGRHWTNRGQGNVKPAGVKVLKVSKGPGFAVLESQTSPWPEKFQEVLKPRFRGYTFNSKQEPTFHYTLGSLEVTDRPEPVLDGLAIKRTITVQAPEGGPENLTFRALVGWPLQELGPRRFDMGGQAVVEISQVGTGQPYVRNGNELLVPLVFKNGEATITLTYTWN